jgi:hypothetical protein
VEYGTGVSGGWKAPDEAQPKGRFALLGAAAVPVFFAWRKFASRKKKQKSRGRQMAKGKVSKIVKAGRAGITAVKPAGKTAARKLREKIAA